MDTYKKATYQIIIPTLFILDPRIIIPIDKDKQQQQQITEFKKVTTVMLINSNIG
jgi:hypothetical protein